MHNLRVETFIKIIFLVSLVSIISAYFIEYVLGHQTCNLCLIERIPYGLAVVLIILNHILIKNKRFMILLLILVFSFSLIISFYHFGIEQGIFEESAVCELIDTSNIVSKEELLKQLQVKNVSCKDVTFRIFGFSLTSLNIIISLILVIFLSKVFKNYEKFKK
jgi:disulfide bond formation protein DsbB